VGWKLHKSIIIGLVVLLVLQPPLSLAFQKKVLFLEIKLPQDHVFSSITTVKEYFFTRTVPDGQKVRINALYYDPIGQQKGTVFYLHGTLGNMETQEKHIREFVKLGYAVFTYDYRSYGKSKGVIGSEEDFHNDAAYMFREFLSISRLSEDQVVIAGRSLGTGLAVPLAAKFYPKSLILISPYWQMTDVAKRFMPLMPRPLIEKNLKYNFRSDLRIQEVKCPVYIFHGTLDEVIPFRSGKKFEPYALHHGEFVAVKGAGHLNITRFTTFQEKLYKILSY